MRTENIDFCSHCCNNASDHEFPEIKNHHYNLAAPPPPLLPKKVLFTCELLCSLQFHISVSTYGVWRLSYLINFFYMYSSSSFAVYFLMDVQQILFFLLWFNYFSYILSFLLFATFRFFFLLILFPSLFEFVPSPYNWIH